MATIKNPTVPIFYREIVSLTIDNSWSSAGTSVQNRPIHEPFDADVVKSKLNAFLKPIAKTNIDLKNIYGFYSSYQQRWSYSFALNSNRNDSSVVSISESMYNGSDRTAFENTITDWSFGYPSAYTSSPSSFWAEYSICNTHPTYVTKKIYE